MSLSKQLSSEYMGPAGLVQAPGVFLPWLLSSSPGFAVLNWDGITLSLSSKDTWKQDCSPKSTRAYIAGPFLCGRYITHGDG